MQAGGGFSLIRRVLRREAVEPVNPQPLQLNEVVPERARLRRAPAGAGDHVPPIGIGHARPASPRVDVDDGPAAADRQVDRPAVRRLERHAREPRTAQVTETAPSSTGGGSATSRACPRCRPYSPPPAFTRPQTE